MAKLSEILYEKTESLWLSSTEEPFLVKMAEGTLDQSLFRNYMLQDYFYILEYIKILKELRSLAKKPAMQRFMEEIISVTEKECFLVHIPEMKKLGIGDEEREKTKACQVVWDYTSYIHKQVKEEGFLAGLTALLQCSWSYAYIGRKMTEKYGSTIPLSPYKAWFEAYSVKEYVEANQLWIDSLDREWEAVKSENIRQEAETTEKLCRIFQSCAEYELLLWQSLYQGITKMKGIGGGN